MFGAGLLGLGISWSYEIIIDRDIDKYVLSIMQPPGERQSDWGAKISWSSI